LAAVVEVKVQTEVTVVVLLPVAVTLVGLQATFRPVAFTTCVIAMTPLKPLMLPKVSVVEFDAPEVNLTSVRLAEIVKSAGGTVTVIVAERS
jgi:hypothetical protein